MDKVASLSSQDRSDVFRYTANEMNIEPAIIEKDFWVCWTLKYLFGHSTLSKDLIFKGGTTLSKVYNIIQRFSEDIDISISRSLLGFDGEHDPGSPELSNKKRRALMEDMSTACSAYVCTDMKSEMESLFSEVIRSMTVYDRR